MSNEEGFYGTDHHHHKVVRTETSPDRVLEQAERLAVLETKFEQLVADNSLIKKKLDELLELKQKGLGAFWLVGLVVGTGLLGLASTILGFFNKGHL